MLSFQDPKVVQYTLAVFYLFVGVLVVVLAFAMPQMTLSNRLIFMFLGVFLIIAAIMQLVSIPQFVSLAQGVPETASIDTPDTKLTTVPPAVDLKSQPATSAPSEAATASSI